MGCKKQIEEANLLGRELKEERKKDRKDEEHRHLLQLNTEQWGSLDADVKANLVDFYYELRGGGEGGGVGEGGEGEGEGEGGEEGEAAGGKEGKEGKHARLLRARAPGVPVQGLRHGLLPARAPEEPVQGLRHGPLRHGPL
jgi:hypothetical protein